MSGLESKPRPRIEILVKPHIKSIASRDELTTINEPKGEDVFSVGDLVWVKIPGFPYWPGMVSIDPVERIHTKATSHRNFKASHVYHVQYFGDPPSRNWTMPGLTVPFNGPELDLPNKSASAKKAAQLVGKSRKKGYENAINEACEALTWDKLTRVRRLTYDYVLVDRSTNSSRPLSSSRTPTSGKNSKPTTNSKSKSKSARTRGGAAGSGGTDNSATDDVYDFDESFDETMETMDQPVMIWSKRPADSLDLIPNSTSTSTNVASEKKIENSSESSESAAPSSADESSGESAKNKNKNKLKVKVMLPKAQQHSTPAKKARHASPLKLSFSLSSSSLPTAKTRKTTQKNAHDKTKTAQDTTKPDTPRAVTPLRPASRQSTPRSLKIKSKVLASRSSSKTDAQTQLEEKVQEQNDIEDQHRASGNNEKEKTIQIQVDKSLQTQSSEKDDENDNSHVSDNNETKDSTLNAVDKNDMNQRNADESALNENFNDSNTSFARAGRAGRHQKRGEVDDQGREMKVTSARASLGIKRKLCEHPTANDMTSSEDASSASDFELVTDKGRLDRLCNVCHEETGKLFYCRGTCLRTMHAECGGSESSSKDSCGFICQECKTGKHPCFVCHSSESKTIKSKSKSNDSTQQQSVIKCSHKNCGKYYHLSCISTTSYPASLKSDTVFVCPLHYCLSCYTDHPYPRDLSLIKPSKRQLVKCLCCPTAYHNSESCIAAGTISFTSSYVMCPAHRNTKNEKHLNVSWCFSCNEGGQLVCCESCPAAFHADCIDPPLQNEDQYFCFDCLRRKQLHYGDIIWIKLGSYRWWPARITHPNSVPENILRLSHQKGDFPVYFFGSHDYFWSHRGRVFTFIEEDTHQNYGHQKATTNNKKFKQALAEAREACAQRKLEEDQRLEKLLTTEKPIFKLIKSNRPVKDYQYDNTKTERVSRCECQPEGDVLCGTDDCLNRLMMLECHPATCPVGEKCKNQRFRNREYAVCVPFRTQHAGWGLRTTQDIKRGDFVIEYVGELIDEAECQNRMAAMREKGDTNFYFLTIDKERIIDAGPAANHARFMNHSCQPNCETQKWVVNGQTRVGLFAICDISAGSELTFNYNLDCRGNEKTKCRCNSDNCSGFIGVRPKDKDREKDRDKDRDKEKDKEKDKDREKDKDKEKDKD